MAGIYRLPLTKISTEYGNNSFLDSAFGLAVLTLPVTLSYEDTGHQWVLESYFPLFSKKLRRGPL